MFLPTLCSDDESEDQTPLSKKAKNIQTQDVVLPKGNPIIDIPESPEQNKRPAEDQEPSSSKKRKVTRKSETAALKLMDPDNIDDIVDDMHLEASDDVRFPRSQDVRL